MKALLIINLLIFLTTVQCGTSFYTMASHQYSYYMCYKQTASSRITLWLNEGNNVISSNAVLNVKTAQSAGLGVEGMFIPCRNQSSDMYVSMLSQAFPWKIVDRYWLNPLEGSTGCGWNNYSPESNCQYLVELINKIQYSLSTPVGIITNRDRWVKFFNNYEGCPEVGGSQLWWNPISSTKQDFSDYLKFGGWNKPYAKIIGSRSVCGDNLVESYNQSLSTQSQK